MNLMLLLSLSACKFDEGFGIYDLRGRVVLPPEAATRAFNTVDGPQTITDARVIGPVYIGVFPSVVEGLYPYAHPEIGPVFQSGIDGDTYPYGGTSIGDVRNPCVSTLVCKVVSGRYVTFDDMVYWFSDVLQKPITDSTGQVVDNGDYIAETCFENLEYTTEAEIRLTVTDDVNGDGEFTELDLDFVEQDDGTWAADFVLWQQEWFEDEECDPETDRCGFTLWGWMDAPAETTYKFNTCEDDLGYRETTYDQDWYAGRPAADLLNNPGQYISPGDWVSGNPESYWVYASPEDEDVEIRLDFLME